MGTKAYNSRFLCGIVAAGVAVACLAGCGRGPAAAGGTTGGDSQAEAGSGTSSDTGGTEMNKQEVLEALRDAFGTDFSEYVADAHGMRTKPGSEYYSADLTVIEGREQEAEQAVSELCGKGQDASTRKRPIVDELPDFARAELRTVYSHMRQGRNGAKTISSIFYVATLDGKTHLFVLGA